jgi:hypothetical protein
MSNVCARGIITTCSGLALLRSSRLRLCWLFVSLSQLADRPAGHLGPACCWAGLLVPLRKQTLWSGLSQLATLVIILNFNLVFLTLGRARRAAAFE